MKRVLKVVIVCLLLLAMAAAVQAEPLKDYEEARDIYDSALACMAAYSNRLGYIGVSRLEQENWRAKFFDIKKEVADAKFLFLQKKDPASGKVTVMLAVAGTESVKDVANDLKIAQVPFAGAGFAEFEARAGEKNVAHTLPKVHKGFHQVTQTALTADILEGPGELYIANHLLANPEHKIILAGHSLGGAVATLYAARLVSMGVRPEQIRIITFGAPAVGNAAFAAAFRDRLNLTRIVVSGDQVTSILQDAVKGYVQPVAATDWEAPKNIVMHPHHIPVYLNAAAKNFYDARDRAVKAGVVSVPLRTADYGARVYVAPVRNELPAALQAEFPYLVAALGDEYRAMFGSYFFAEGAEDLSASLDKAAAAGCEWLVAAAIEGRASKTEEGVFFISLQHIVYRVKDRTVVNMYGYSDSTEHATPFGAFLNGIRKMHAEFPLHLTGDAPGGR
jgi:surfactin synthase thioesterase subunit